MLGTGHTGANTSALEWSIEYFTAIGRQFKGRYGPHHCSLQIPVDGMLPDLPRRENYSKNKEWVSAYMRSLQNSVEMSHLPVQVFGLERNHPKLATHRELPLPGNPDAKERYYTDAYGHPVAYYEPSQLEKRGYLLRRFTDVLSDMIQFGSHPQSQNEHSTYQSRSDIIACFLGLGLVRIEGTEASALRDIALMRGTILFLNAKGYGSKSIKSIYGKVLGETYGKLLNMALVQMTTRKTLNMIKKSGLIGTQQSQYSLPRQVPA